MSTASPSLPAFPSPTNSSCVSLLSPKSMIDHILCAVYRQQCEECRHDWPSLPCLPFPWHVFLIVIEILDDRSRQASRSFIIPALPAKFWDSRCALPAVSGFWTGYQTQAFCTVGKHPQNGAVSSFCPSNPFSYSLIQLSFP